MALLDIFEKPSKPYSEESQNVIYELLFCDDIDLYKSKTQEPNHYPWTVLFSDVVDVNALESLANDDNAESRVRVLAFNELAAKGAKIKEKTLLGVIIEVGLDSGLDVLASYKDGSARYINQSGKMIIWENQTEASKALTWQLFIDSESIVQKIGPWDKPRKQPPAKGNTRITFLVSDGLYFGEGQTNTLFNDPLASQALQSATNLMKYLTSMVK